MQAVSDALGSEYHAIRFLAVMTMLDIRQIELANSREELKVVEVRNRKMWKEFDKALWKSNAED